MERAEGQAPPPPALRNMLQRSRSLHDDDHLPGSGGRVTDPRLRRSFSGDSGRAGGSGSGAGGEGEGGPASVDVGGPGGSGGGESQGEGRGAPAAAAVRVARACAARRTDASLFALRGDDGLAGLGGLDDGLASLRDADAGMRRRAVCVGLFARGCEGRTGHSVGQGRCRLSAVSLSRARLLRSLSYTYSSPTPLPLPLPPSLPPPSLSSSPLPLPPPPPPHPAPPPHPPPSPPSPQEGAVPSRRRAGGRPRRAHSERAAPR